MAGTQMVLRQNIASQWVVNNRVLAAGEFGVEIDTRLLKVGDGVSAWTELPYIGYYPANAKVVDSELLDGYNSFEFLLKEDATRDYTKKSDKVVDTDLLDGLDSSKFMRADVAAGTYDKIIPLSGPPGNRPTNPWVNLKYLDTSNNDLIAWSGTRWQKVGGPTRYIGGTSSTGPSGNIPVRSKVAVRSVVIPAHTSGELKLSVCGQWSSDRYEQAMTTELWVNTVAPIVVGGSGQRTSTSGITFFRSEGYYVSPGTTFTLSLAVFIETNDPTYIVESSFSAWLGSMPL